MIRLAADMDFNGDIFEGVRRRLSELDFVRAQDIGLDETSDPEVLEWCARERRILLSHDR